MKIESICGIKPDGNEYIDPGNNPNFVFESDPNFSPVTLYDIDGNIINVNSWVECAHYVTGGWTTNQLALDNGLKYLTFILLVVSTVVTVVVLLKKRNVIKESEI